MALQTSYTDPITGVTAATAYVRVIGIVVDCVAQTIDLTVGIYADAAARTNGNMPFGTFHAWPSYAAFLGQSVDVRAAAYGYLATLSQFSGSTSVA